MRTLVVGGDSLIGAAFIRAMGQRGGTCYATTRHRGADGGKRIYLDLASDEVETAVLPEVDIAFFCAAVSGFAVCRNDPALARRVNVEGTGRLVRRLADRGVYSVLLSSTAVFDFKKPHVPADAPVNPQTDHGKIKAEAERLFLELGELGSILRLTKVIDPAAPLFMGWLAALSRSGQIAAYSDLHIAPLAVEDATRAMDAVAADRGRGIYQLSGARDISYFDVARHLATMLRVPIDRVEPTCATEDGIPPAEVARHTTLDNSRIKALTGCPARDPYDVTESVFEPQIANFTKITISSRS